MPVQENLALASAGAKISMATSWHPVHKAENTIDGNNKTFWVTTGLFPHELILTLTQVVAVRKIIITSMKVARWTVESSVAEKPQKFEMFTEQDVEDADQAIQTVTLLPSNPETSARHLRLIITKGHAPFTSVHKIVVYGDPVSSAG
ncbi:hypothetical protein SpCBS45565_g02296 [Spizellomyces sp. 'palustris']|nr:hypothetical protein SpCBS45565_g02296 [Spizellomyces sp. 'palustris']